MRRLALGKTRVLAAFTVALAGGFGAAALADRSASEAGTPPQNITGGQTLVAGQTLESPGGQYLLELASNGNLQELYSGGKVLWQTTGGVAGDHALLQPNGNLVLLSSTGETLWSSNSSGTGCPTLDLQRDGNLVIYDTAAVFAKGVVDTLSDQPLDPGWNLYSASGQYVLAMQGDGNLVVYSDTGKPLWASNTAGNSGARAFMQADGNLVVYSSAGKPLWASNTAGNSGDSLIMQNDGNLVIYSRAGKPLWASNTSGAANNGTSIDPKGPAASATPCPTPAPQPAPTAPSGVTVTPTTATSQTVPVPARAHQVSVRLTVKWRWRGPITRLERLTVGRMPRAAHFTAFYRRRRGRHHRHVREASNKREIRSLIRWLEHTRYRAGDTLSFKISRHGDIPERARFRIRYGKLPKLTT